MNAIHYRLTVALLAVILLVGCTSPATVPSAPSASGSTPTVASPTPAPTATPDMLLDDRHYTMYMDSGKTLTFDAQGNIVPKEEQFDTMRDILTGEPVLLTRRRTKVDEEPDKDGYPVSRRLTAVYSLDGKLLHDWSEYDYEYAFGDYVVRRDMGLYMWGEWGMQHDEEFTSVWNYKTGEDVIKGVAIVKKLNDNLVLLCAVDETFMGVMDINSGEPVFRPAPEGYGYTYEWYGYILADSKTGNMNTLMDSSFKTIFSHRDMNGSFYRLRGPYIIYSDDSAHVAIINEKGEKLFATTFGDEDINYFDGEIALLDRVEISGGRRNFTRRMLKTDGTELAAGYSTLMPCDEYEYDSEQPAPFFVGMRGNTVDLIDRTGKVTATVDIPELGSIDTLGEGLYSYTLLPESNLPNGNGRDTEGFVGILDNNLNTIIQANRYTFIEQCASWGSRNYQRFDLLRCMRTASGGVLRWDMVDTSGKVLIENLTEANDFGPNRLAAIKGFSAGLMDWQGNWVAKRSIFDSIEDEWEALY